MEARRTDPRTKAAWCRVQTQTQSSGCSAPQEPPAGTQLRNSKNGKVPGRPAEDQVIGVRWLGCVPVGPVSDQHTSPDEKQWEQLRLDQPSWLVTKFAPLD